MKIFRRFRVELTAVAVSLLMLFSLGVSGRQTPNASGPQAAAPPNGPPTPQRFRYVCEGSAPVVVVLHGETARVTFKGKVFHMKQTESASGARYSDGSMVWWNKGRDGFLQVNDASGNGQMVAKDCHQQPPPDPANRP
jgi:membrane-bound inhibitor of C-type lysozyme